MSLAFNPLKCFRIVRRDITASPIETVLARLTWYPHDVTMDTGAVYRAVSGYLTGYEQGISAAPTAIDVEVFSLIAGVTVEQLLAGYLDHCHVYQFRTTWHTPVEDEFEEGHWLIGKGVRQDDKIRIEMTSLIDTLSQKVGYNGSTLCHKELGSQGRGGCKLAIADYTYTGTVTGAGDGYTFIDTALHGSVSPTIDEDNFFAPGVVTFLTGNNAGFPGRDIQASAAGTGAITIFDPFHFSVQVGDQYQIIRGCPKTLDFCKRQVNAANTSGTNVENFGAQVHKPTEEFFKKTAGV